MTNRLISLDEKVVNQLESTKYLTDEIDETVQQQSKHKRKQVIPTELSVYLFVSQCH